jgi:hemolysin activation/secretion protein
MRRSAPAQWATLVLVVTLALGAVALTPIAFAPTAFAQSGSRIIDRDRLDNRPQIPAAPAQPPPAATSNGPSAPPTSDETQILLHEIVVQGSAALPANVIHQTWQQDQNKTIPLREVYAIADRIAAAYAKAGLALYKVDVPTQDFAPGIVHIRVVEGYVDAVTIQGDTAHGDLSLLQAYAAHIVAARPLLQSTVERYILLMNDIAGLTVGSTFEPIQGQPGAVRLVLTIARKRFEEGIGVDNQGQAQLSRTSLEANIGVNSLLREGDRTQLVFGAPLTIDGYQFYGVVHREPIGTDGATLQFNAGYLTTRPAANEISGNAATVGVRLSYPVIRALKESLVASVEADALNADNAELSDVLSDERTRVLRGALTYAVQDDAGDVSVASTTLSAGLNGLGARRGSAASGPPDFSKVIALLSREQQLPLSFILRVMALGQFSGTELPASEQFSYGGQQFGRSFDNGAVRGDRGFAISAELAYPVQAAWMPAFTGGSEVYGFGDYGRVFNVAETAIYKTDAGSSAGFGARTKLLEKVTLDLSVDRTLLQPREVSGHAAWRLVFAVHGTF